MSRHSAREQAASRMSVGLLAGALLARSRVRRRDRWSPERVRDFQSKALARLVKHAQRSSPYYADRLAGLDGASLSELPVLTKSDLMDHWDRICTTDAISRKEVEHRLIASAAEGLDPGRPWRGRWWLAATGGTTGKRAVLAWDRTEWIHVLASYARVNDWAGVSVGFRNPLRTAVVSSVNPTHQSAVVGASLRSALVQTLRLDARQSLPEIIDQLNGFQPRLLVAYASMIGPLAAAQRDGSLAISPEHAVSASEVLLPAARQLAERVWGAGIMVDTYAATECAGVASSCPLGNMHLYEDFVIAEPVDDDYQPVARGERGSRLLVTPLFSRTLPLIRYELTDAVRLSTRSCDCGLPFSLLEAVEGRTQDTLTFTTPRGIVTVHPIVFHHALDASAPDGWQVEQMSDTLVVRVVGRADLDEVASRVTRALTEQGISAPSVRVDSVSAIERTALGKSPLVKASRPKATLGGTHAAPSG